MDKVPAEVGDASTAWGRPLDDLSPLSMTRGKKKQVPHRAWHPVRNDNTKVVTTQGIVASFGRGGRYPWRRLGGRQLCILRRLRWEWSSGSTRRRGRLRLVRRPRRESRFYVPRVTCL